MDLSKRFLRTAEAATFAGLSPRTLEALRLKGGGPPYCRPRGRRFVVYDVADLERWMWSGKRRSTSDEPGAEA